MPSRESIDAAGVRSFIHPPAPAHTSVYTRAIWAGGPNPRGAARPRFGRNSFVDVDRRGDQPQPKRGSS